MWKKIAPFIIFIIYDLGCCVRVGAGSFPKLLRKEEKLVKSSEEKRLNARKLWCLQFSYLQELTPSQYAENQYSTEFPTPKNTTAWKS